jgi:CBS domain-containing protein
MKVSEILKAKGSRVESITPDKTIKEAMDIITGKNIGSLPVLENNILAGIITERDILHLMEKEGEKALSKPVGEVMTTRLVVGVLEDEVDTVMALMTNNRFRHLPIMDGRKMVGIISIGDIVKTLVKNLQIENRYLMDYITGKYPG